MEDLEISKEFLEAVKTIQMPRTEFALRNFVVFEKDSEAQAWLQCVIEASVKITNLRHSAIDKEITKEKIKKLKEKGDRISLLKAQKHEMSLEEAEIAEIGTRRELEVLLKIFKEFGRTFTREEIDADQANYWRQRLTRQAAIDYMSTGRVGVGNMDALRMAGMKIPNFIEADTIKRLGFDGGIADVEKRYIEEGNERILIAIPTVKKLEDQDLINRLMPIFPVGKQIKVFNVHGLNIPNAFTKIAEQALADNPDYVLTIEDDTFAPKDALGIFLKEMKTNPEIDAIGAWYPRRNALRDCTSMMILSDRKRGPVPDDGKIHEVVTLPFGFTLLKTELFRKIAPPWFAMTDNLSQDSFFSRKARDAGFRLFTHSGVKAKHIDRETGEVFE